MLVDIVRLRLKDERLTRHVLNATGWVRGHLNVHQRFDHHARRDVYVATLTRGDFASTEQLMPALDQVRLGRLKGNDFVLLGIEDLSHRKVSAIYAQAWWCQISSQQPRPTPFDDADAR